MIQATLQDEKVQADNIPSELAAKRQWVLWRYEERGGKPTKVPYRVSGEHASTVDPSSWVTMSEALAELYDDPGKWSGIGFVFTPEDDFIGIDLDDCIDDAGKLLPWASEIIDGFDSYAEISPSGKGVKIFLRGNFPLDRGRKVKLNDGGGGIEVYTKGRYFTVTGNALDGNFSEVSTMDDQTIASFADHYFTPSVKPVVSQQPITVNDSPDIIHRATAYAQAYPPAIAGQGGHDATFRLACVLVNGFELGEAAALGVLQDWNQGCQPPWSDKELGHKIRSAAKSGSGGDRGYMLQDEAPVFADEVDLSGFKGCFTENEANSQVKAPSQLPRECLNAPGLIGEVVNYMLRSALYPLPEVSLAAAISLMSVLVCRKVKTFKGATPNVYMIGIAPSGSGKDHPRRVVRDILNAANGGSLIGPESYKSGSAIVESLTVNPALLAQIDEIRDFFRAVGSSNASPWLQDVATVLLTVWGSGLASPWKPSARADSKYNREVYCPQPVIFGTTTELIWQSITADMKDGGLLGRFCTLESVEAVKMQSDPFDESNEELPPSIIESVRRWIELKPAGNLNDQYPESFRVPITEAAKAGFRGHWEEIEKACKGADEATRGLLTRSQEITSRLALVAACACHDPLNGLNDLEIDGDHVAWAESLVSWSNEIKLYQVSRHIAESSHHKNVLKVKRAIQDAGKKGLSSSELTRKTQWVNSQTRRDILLGLAEGGEIEVVEQPTARRPKTIYRIA